MMTLGINIKGIDCCGQHTLIWNDKFLQVYDVNVQQGANLIGNFESRANVCALTQDSVVNSRMQESLKCALLWRSKTGAASD